MQGPVIVKNNKNKIIFIGEYFNGLKNGNGTTFYNDGSIHFAKYQNNQIVSTTLIDKPMNNGQLTTYEMIERKVVNPKDV